MHSSCAPRCRPGRSIPAPSAGFPAWELLRAGPSLHGALKHCNHSCNTYKQACPPPETTALAMATHCSLASGPPSLLARLSSNAQATSSTARAVPALPRARGRNGGGALAASGAPRRGRRPALRSGLLVAAAGGGGAYQPYPWQSSDYHRVGLQMVQTGGPLGSGSNQVRGSVLCPRGSLTLLAGAWHAPSLACRPTQSPLPQGYFLLMRTTENELVEDPGGCWRVPSQPGPPAACGTSMALSCHGNPPAFPAACFPPKPCPAPPVRLALSSALPPFA